MVFKIVISDPKTRQAWQIEKDTPSLIGLKIGDGFDGSILGMNGFTLQITGGSDKDGFPMRADIPSVGRKKVLLSAAPGYRPLKIGIRKRKYVRGNTISEDISQINCKIVMGEGNVGEILGIKPKEKKEEAKKEEPKKEEVKLEKPKEDAKKGE